MGEREKEGGALSIEGEEGPSFTVSSLLGSLNMQGERERKRNKQFNSFNY